MGINAGGTQLWPLPIVCIGVIKDERPVQLRISELKGELRCESGGASLCKGGTAWGRLALEEREVQIPDGDRGRLR